MFFDGTSLSDIFPKNMLWGKGFKFWFYKTLSNRWKKQEKLIDFVMFGMRFLTNFEAFIYIISLKGITNKIIYFSLTQNGCKKAFILFAIPLRKIRQKQVLKLVKNRHTKHHQIDQKTWKFDRFDDVWYVFFDQFWKFYLYYFPQEYGFPKKAFLNLFWV